MPEISNRQRKGLKMTLDGSSKVVRQRKISLLRTPALMKRRAGLTHCIQNKLLRQQGFGDKMGKLVLRIAVEALGPAEFPSGLVVLYAGDRRNEIIGRYQRRIAPVGINKQPVLKVHERALEETDKRAEKPILLLTDGDIRRASSLAGRMVYKATPFMLRRLQIEKVPSLVTQDGQRLRVKEMILK